MPKPKTPMDSTKEYIEEIMRLVSQGMLDDEIYSHPAWAQFTESLGNLSDEEKASIPGAVAKRTLTTASNTPERAKPGSVLFTPEQLESSGVGLEDPERDSKLNQAWTVLTGGDRKAAPTREQANALMAFGESISPGLEDDTEPGVIRSDYADNTNIVTPSSGRQNRRVSPEELERLQSESIPKSFYVSRSQETLKSYIHLKKLNPNNYVIVPIPNHLRNNSYLKSVNYNVENPNFKYMLIHKSFITFANDATPVLKVKDLKQNEYAKKNNNPQSKKNTWEYVKKYGKMNSKTKGLFDNRDPEKVLNEMTPDEIDNLLKTSPEFARFFEDASDQARIQREEGMDYHGGAGSGEQFKLNL